MPPNPIEVLTNNGLQNAETIVRAANATGLIVATAATLAEMESGGRMVWGHDPVNTGGTYTKGGPVTPENYAAYRKSRVAGWQGVGIMQLTYKGFIFECERLHPNGAADPYTNCVVGMRAFLSMWNDAGRNVQLAFQRYNGGTSNSEASRNYAARAMQRRAVWLRRLG